MHPEPLIQKLFAIERAIDGCPRLQLRAMVVEAEEAALRMDLDNLHRTDELHRRLNERSATGRASSSLIIRKGCSAPRRARRLAL